MVENFPFADRCSVPYTPDYRKLSLSLPAGSSPSSTVVVRFRISLGRIRVTPVGLSGKTARPRHTSLSIGVSRRGGHRQAHLDALVAPRLLLFVSQGERRSTNTSGSSRCSMRIRRTRSCQSRPNCRCSIAVARPLTQSCISPGISGEAATCCRCVATSTQRRLSVRQKRMSSGISALKYRS